MAILVWARKARRLAPAGALAVAVTAGLAAAGASQPVYAAASVNPVTKVTEKGKLPPGLRFVANKNGTAVITGKPAPADRGKQYMIQLTANNGVSPAAAQRFTIQVT
jgi:hypothetical protein